MVIIIIIINNVVWCYPGYVVVYFLFFEGNNEDIFITPPLGGFPHNVDAMILIYKERDYLYEPILYRERGKYVEIIE